MPKDKRRTFFVILVVLIITVEVLVIYCLTGEPENSIGNDVRSEEMAKLVILLYVQLDSILLLILLFLLLLLKMKEILSNHQTCCIIL